MRPVYSDHIRASVPEACGERDCPVGWHIAHYWAYSDGTFSVCDSDGNHGDVDESDIPSFEDQEAAWYAYAQHVAETGEDPIGEYLVPTTRTVRERYRATFRQSILGPVLVRVRRRYRDVPLRDLPPYLTDYLNVQRKSPNSQWVFNGDWEQLVTVIPGKRPADTSYQVSFDVTVENLKPRPDATVRRERRRIATRHLKTGG